MQKTDPISHEEARAYYHSEKMLIEPLSFLGSGTVITPEVSELARGLRYDPKLIYDYVHNHIDYVPYFGSLKGATLTYLDGSGNDFDQASLMIALLKESRSFNLSIGTIQYVYGTMIIPGANLANWLGVDQTPQIIGTVLPSGGVPIRNLQTDGTATVTRVWVKANIGGTDYLFDPAFKAYDYKTKINIGQAMVYNKNDLMAEATYGATIGSDYVQNLNEVNLRNKLAAYSSNLVNTIRSQYPNSDVNEVISGRSIVRTNLTQYTTTLPFSPVVTELWDEIPQSKTATLRIQHVGIDYTFDITELGGNRLTLTYNAGIGYRPELYLDGVLITYGTSTTFGSKNNLTMSVDHPYAASGGSYADQTVIYPLESGRAYAIVSNFGGVSDALILKRQKQLDIYLAQGLPETSEAVRGETLNVMGQTWLKECQTVNRLLSALAETVSINHHTVGIMAQEAGYYIDVKAAMGSIISKHNIDADQWAHFKVYSLIASAFEHGILEQLMGSDKPAASTMKLFQIANATSRKIFYANNSNYSAIRPQLQNYSTAELGDFQSQVNSGETLILPDNGQLVLNQWRGKGYISKYFSENVGSMGMIIGGNYFGGYGGNPVPVSPPVVNNNTQITTTNNVIPSTTYLNVSPYAISTSRDPVDMASGGYLYDRTDLQLGGGAPLGLAFTRSYNSNRNLSKRTLGYGWTHNYDIYLSMTSHGDPGLGRRQPVDASANIAALYVMLDLLKTQDAIQYWVVASLISKWAVDQVIDNSFTVHLGHKVMEFVKLPNGTYAPPPGLTTQLIKNQDQTFSLIERFGTRINFDNFEPGKKRITQLIDVDGNTMSFTYNPTDLTVRDAFNRTLTLQYAGGQNSDSIGFGGQIGLVRV
jgi:hypothetical protein